MGRFGVMAVMVVVASGLAACDDGIPARAVMGGRGHIEGGLVWTWANLDSHERVMEVGVTIPVKSLEAMGDGTSLVLELPWEAQDATFVRSVQIEYKARKHLPEIFQVPRLDVRFFGVDEAARQGIDCREESIPGQELLPAPYLVESAAAEPDGSCVPGLGVHAFNGSAPELNPVNKVPFRSALLLGYHHGDIIFVGPTVALEELQKRKSFDVEVPQPAGLQSQKLWPRRAALVTDIRQTVVHFSLGKLTEVKAQKSE